MLKLVTLGHFLPFIPLKTPIIKIFPVIEKETDKIFCHFGSFFALLPPPNYSEYQNFEKTEKNAWRYHPFIHTCVP